MIDPKHFNQKFHRYSQSGFIEHDPVCIPHAFSKKQDIEIAGLFAAVLAWGQRATIIRKCRELMQRMDNAPHDFMLNASGPQLKSLLGFKHRTFNDTDLLYFVEFLRHHYAQHDSLETAFSQWISPGDTTIEQALTGFHNYFFSLKDFPRRTIKHISTPARKSACKRLNMFLRWMVRSDEYGIDFGLWKAIEPSQLVCPLDVHVDRVARRYGLITRKQTDWLTALELTENLRNMDPRDPVKYDIVLFSEGVEERRFPA